MPGKAATAPGTQSYFLQKPGYGDNWMDWCLAKIKSNYQSRLVIISFRGDTRVYIQVISINKEQRELVQASR